MPAQGYPVCSRCVNNWSSEMKSLFNATEIGWIYDNMDQCNASVFENKCMKSLTERWLLGLSLKPKLRTYLLFKNDLSPEPYVKLCKSRRKRSILAVISIPTWIPNKEQVCQTRGK